MSFLLDTHVLIWALREPEKLSPAIRQLIDSSDVLVSSATFLEIQIKRKLGKLQFDFDLEDLVTDQVVIPLSISYKHSLAVYDLPMIHQDPFDRLLIAQSIIEGIPLITRDKTIQKYDLGYIPA